MANGRILRYPDGTPICGHCRRAVGAKLSPFEEMFSEPRDWGDCWVVARQEGETHEDAVAVFTAFFEGYDPDWLPVRSKSVTASTVRFQLVSREDYEWWDEHQTNGRCAVWCLDERGRGAKPVWVMET